VLNVHEVGFIAEIGGMITAGETCLRASVLFGTYFEAAAEYEENALMDT